MKMNLQNDPESKMTRRERLLWAVAVLLALGAGVWMGGSPLSASIEKSHAYQHAMEAVHYYLKELHVDPPSEDRLWLGAIRGMVDSTGDPYTRFLNEEEVGQFTGLEEGQRVGIGVEVSLKGGIPVVIAPVDDGPAMKAGVMSGDRIVAVDGTQTRGLDFGELLQLIGGDPGTVVKLTIERPGFPDSRDIAIRRDVFKLEYVKYGYLKERKVGYLRLSHFFGEDVGSIDKFKEALLEFRNAGARGVILDLRNNSGGHLDMARTLAGFFLESGKVVVVARGREESDEVVHKASGETMLLPGRIPLVVMINRGSASASEILAGALQDHKRAILVGETSFGKASVQRVIRPLPGNTAALVTIQKYYTPDLRSIHGKGLEPDVSVPGFEPGIEEAYYLKKMKDKNFIEEFFKKNKSYSKDLVGRLKKESEKQGWKISDELAFAILNRQFVIHSGDIPDPEMDRQFAKALEVVLK